MHELANRIIDHYERHANAWDADRRMTDWNDKPWHDRFIAALPNDARILDLGCGSGFPVAEYMVARGLRVVGVDSSPTLISLCRQRLPDQEWVAAFAANDWSTGGGRTVWLAKRGRTISCAPQLDCKNMSFHPAGIPLVAIAGAPD